MTAALLDHRGARDTRGGSAPNASGSVQKDAAGTSGDTILDPPASTSDGEVAAGEAHETGHRRPHLIAVPESEPPLEPLPADPDSAAAAAHGISFAPWPNSYARPPFHAADVHAAAKAAPAHRGTPLPWRTATISQRRWAPAGQLPRSAATPAPHRPVTAARRTHSLIVTSVGVPDWSTDCEMGVRATPTAALPPALDAGTALVRGLLEALSGRRTLAQLRIHCAPDVFAGLIRLGSLRDPHLHLLTVWACEPADGVAEISAAFRCGARTRALALRLEGIDGRWRITVLHLG